MPEGYGVHLIVAIGNQVVVQATTALQQRHILNPFFRQDASIGSGSKWLKCSCINRGISASQWDGLPLSPIDNKILRRRTDRSSGCVSPVDFYIFRFLCHSSSQISVTAPSDIWLRSKYLTDKLYYHHTESLFFSNQNGVFLL